MAGAAMAPMSGEQKRDLVLLAKRAFEKSGASSQASESFEDWRHHQVKIATERNGLRECRNEDFLPLQAHFLRLIGQTAMADRRVLKYETEPRRWALHKLEAECGEAKDVIDRPMEYVLSICRARYKVQTLDDLDEKRIWVLMFDLRRNAQRRRAKGGTCPSKPSGRRRAA